MEIEKFQKVSLMKHVCEHKYKHLETIYKSSYDIYATKYERIDRFFCEKCLDEKEKIKTECSREIPEWWKE